MEITITQILTNGMIEHLQEDPRLLSFVVGALDSGWMVSKPGGYVAKKNKVQFIVHFKGESVHVVLQSKGEIHQIPFEKFQWSDISVIRGKLYYDNKFICSTQAEPEKLPDNVIIPKIPEEDRWNY